MKKKAIIQSSKTILTALLLAALIVPQTVPASSAETELPYAEETAFSEEEAFSQEEAFSREEEVLPDQETGILPECADISPEESDSVSAEESAGEDLCDLRCDPSQTENPDSISSESWICEAESGDIEDIEAAADGTAEAVIPYDDDVDCESVGAESPDSEASTAESSFAETLTAEPEDLSETAGFPDVPDVDGVSGWTGTEQITDLKGQSSSNGPILSWSAVPGAEGYIIGAMQNGSRYRQIGYVSGGGNTRYTDADAGSSDYSFYWVFPFKKVNGRVVSGKASSTYAFGIRLLPAPTGVNAVSDYGSVILSWNAVAGASGYTVKVRRGSGAVTVLAETAGTGYTDTKAPTDPFSFYWIIPNKSSGAVRRPGVSSSYAYGKALAAPADVPAFNAPVNADTVIALARAYDPDGYFILQDSVNRGGKQQIEFWCFSARNAASASDTCVHEEFHGYTHNNGSLDWGTGRWSELYYIGDGANIRVFRGASFPTEEWSGSLPDHLKTFRYNTYVAPGSNPDANTKGAYGLLNEFCAYYWGMHNQMQLYSYYTANNGGNDFRNAVQNGVQAFTEFRFYILGYLNYAKTSHNDIYQAFLNNQEFVNTYCLMERRFEHQIRNAMNLTSAWRNEAITLYNEVQGEAYTAVENELFSRATVQVLPALNLR